MAARSYIGAKVQLLRDITTRGGTTFRKGVVLTVRDSTSGGLEMECYVRGWRQMVRAIPKSDVVVLEWAKKDEEDK